VANFNRVKKCFFFLLVALVSNLASADVFEIPPLEKRLDYSAWMIPEFRVPACQLDFNHRIALAKLEALEQANEKITAAIVAGFASELWLGTEGYLKAGPKEYVQTEKRKFFRQLLFPLAHTGLLFPEIVKANANPNNRKKIAVDVSTYQAAIIFLPGVGFTVSQSDTVIEIAQTFTKGHNPGLHQSRTPLRAVGLPMDVTLNGMASAAPYLFGSRRGSMAMLRHAHLILHVLYPHLKIIVAGRSQGGLISFAYGQTYNDFGLVAAIAANPTYPAGEILRKSNEIHIQPELLERLGMDKNYHPAGFRSYLEFTERDYARVLTDANKIPLIGLVAEKDEGYPQPDYVAAYQRWVSNRPDSRIVVIDAEHHFWSRPSGAGEAAFDFALAAKANFLHPLIYP
jgi:pimeloyl-ACP methyl ester carboxylesterase